LDTLDQVLAFKPGLKVAMITSSDDPTLEQRALASGACAFLRKPFDSADVDHVLHEIYGIRSPNLTIERSEADFDIAVEGSTIRLAHKESGHSFEYLWFKTPPHLRNGTIRSDAPRDPQIEHLMAAAERSALMQLSSARLLAA